jgi:hypothetical protein
MLPFLQIVLEICPVVIWFNQVVIDINSRQIVLSASHPESQ